MAAKRLRDLSEQDSDRSDGKRIKRLPSFSTVIREAMMAKSLQNFFFTLEPLLRKVVQEEIEQGLIRRKCLLQRPNQIQIEAPEPASLKLIFRRALCLPIFTGTKIEDIDNSPIQIMIVSTENVELPVSLPYPLKLEVVVLDGDFPKEDCDDWTSAEFKNSIVKNRTGKRPLITGDVNITLRGGTVCIQDLSFTDNSSWTRSRHFRIGVRIVPESYTGERIKEAITEPFMVKDHRGELYKKHYPPALVDEVWRLERIGKDGAFHKKLLAENANTVQDFLKLWTVDPDGLRKILGMSDRTWEVVIAHAKTCEVGNKLYLHHTPQCDIFLNSICEVTWIMMGGMACTLQDLNQTQRALVQKLAREAYQNWDKLEESDGIFNANIPMIQSYSQIPQNGIEELPDSQVQQENEALGYQLEEYDGFSPDQSFYGHQSF